MTEEYRSTEQKMWDSTKPTREAIGNFVEGFVPASYGVAVSLFRIPTFIRKKDEKQLHIQRLRGGAYTLFSSGFGCLMGGVAGLVADGYILVNFATQAVYHDNAFPLAFLLLTNSASGIYEARRSSKKKKSLESTVRADGENLTFPSENCP